MNEWLLHSNYLFDLMEEILSGLYIPGCKKSETSNAQMESRNN